MLVMYGLNWMLVDNPNDLALAISHIDHPNSTIDLTYIIQSDHKYEDSQRTIRSTTMDMIGWIIVMTLKQRGPLRQITETRIAKRYDYYNHMTGSAHHHDKPNRLNEEVWSEKYTNHELLGYDDSSYDL